MNILGFTIARTQTKSLPAQLSNLSNRSSWWPWGIVRESFTGAWQTNVELRADTALTYFAVYACVTLIASDIGKLCLRLVRQDANGIWDETTSPAFSPVLRKPNRYQNIIKCVEQWVISKLLNGNTYVLKQRDQRGVVVAMYVLDPSRVTPLVAPDGAVYYEVRRDDLSGQRLDVVVVPAREIMHDLGIALFHPLIGVPPIYACGLAATQGLSIQSNSSSFFSNGSNPGGVITVPGAITQPQADLLKASWDTNYTGANAGKVALLTDGMKYEQTKISAVDSQLIEQLKWTAETVCSCFHVPPYMIGVGPPPPYANIEPLMQAYYSQCLQSLIVSLEKCLDEGLGIAEKVDGVQYGTEFDVNDLIWMDTATKIAAASDSVKGSVLSIDESRKTYLGKGPVYGGSSIWMQQQNYSLEALAKRDEGDPFAKPVPPIAPETDEDDDQVEDVEAAAGAWLIKELQDLATA